MDTDRRFIIGLVGPQQHRNDVAADYLTKIKFQRFSIGDEIKNRATECFDWNPNDTTEFNRKILNAVATCGRNIHPDFWTMKIMNRVIDWKDRVSIVIPDLRTDEEIQTFKNLGGIIFFVGTEKVVDKYREEDRLPAVDIYIYDTGDDGELRHHTMLSLLEIMEQEKSPKKKEFGG